MQTLTANPNEPQNQYVLPLLEI